MKANFKRLGLAAAVSAAATGAYAQDAAINAGNLGDAAIVPYYTVQGNWISGLHITNTSDYTQAVKLRWRCGSDSMDALDFNIIMSPKDVWVGFISGDDESNIVVQTGDNTCTAPLQPLLDGGTFPMPIDTPTSPAFNAGAMEGYVEIIGMGAADSAQPVAAAAKHALDGVLSNNGVPADCAAVESNFFRNATDVGVFDATAKGVISNDTTHQTKGNTVVPNTWMDTGNVLSVSYFIRDQASGVEFGSNAVHLQDAFTGPMMTNQARLVPGTYDPYGFYYPDLDGGTPGDPAGSNPAFADRVRPALGVETVMNDWAVGTADRLIDTDWVVTLPGQYLMLDFQDYVASLTSAATCKVNVCDFRDLPVEATISFWDREEDVTTTPEDGLVISPATGTPPSVTLLKNEVNVIKWSGDEGEDDGAFGSQYAINFGTTSTENGWASLAIKAGGAVNGGSSTQKVCPVGDGIDCAADGVDVTGTPVPMVGFVAWKRTLPDQPEASYGRIIDHSFAVSTSS